MLSQSLFLLSKQRKEQMKYITEFHEVPLVELLDDKSLEAINRRFGRSYTKKKKESVARLKEILRFKELKKLMEAKPEGGGYGA